MSLITPSNAYFEGHFPGRPILPGVALLAIVLETLARDTGRAAALRAIPFARLRRPVGPQDVLAIDGRDGEGGRVRFDVKCDGAPVANGELVLGSPDAIDGTAARAAHGAPVAGTVPPVESLVPQQPPMRFVTAVVAETPDGLTCAARIPGACALVAAGSAPALVALEAAAQAAAAWEALRRARAAAAASPRMGYLVAVRDVDFFAVRIPADETFLACARLAATAPPLMHYAVEVTLATRPILRGTVATVLADELIR
jgi:3-hydroxymyristoyl/3-hydroxydecanoyl-(acyl carrier protein) dehydratase